MSSESAVAEGYRRIYFSKQRGFCFDVSDATYRLVERAAAKHRMTPAEYLIARGAAARGLSLEQVGRMAKKQGVTAGVLLMQMGLAQPIEVAGDF